MLTVALVQVQNYCGRGPEYVARLREGLARYLRPKRICLITDDVAANYPGCRCKPADPALDGWWQKLRLFKPGMFPEGERMLYLDLDTVIVGDLRPLESYAGDFACLRDFYRHNGLGSGVMLWRSGWGGEIWERWNAMGRPTNPGGDQWWIELTVPRADRLQDLFPGMFASFKADCQHGTPEGARAVCYHGNPRPHETGWRAAA